VRILRLLLEFPGVKILLLLGGLTVGLLPIRASALSPDAKEFMEITARIEPMQCRKRQLRRQIVLADTEQRAADARRLRDDFARLDRDPATSKLEKRLAELQQRMSNGKGGTLDPEDLAAINKQHVEAFYRCD
jgi:hypothetical protein